MLMMHPEVKKTAGGGRKLTRPPIVLLFVISSPDAPTAPEEDKVRMWRDRLKEKAKTKRGWASRTKNNVERGQVSATVCYLSTLTSCAAVPSALLLICRQMITMPPDVLPSPLSAFTRQLIRDRQHYESHCFPTHSSFSFQTRSKGGREGSLFITMMAWGLQDEEKQQAPV